jgi:hypothetical protein
VAIYDVTAAPAKPIVAWISTSATSIVVPTNILETGHHYFARINAEVQNDLQRFPKSLPAGRARWVSPAFSR